MMDYQEIAAKLVRNGMTKVESPQWSDDFYCIDLVFRHPDLFEEPGVADPGLVYNVVSNQILEMGYTQRYTGARLFEYIPPEGYPGIWLDNLGVRGLEIRIVSTEEWDLSLLETLLPALLKDFSLD